MKVNNSLWKEFKFGDLIDSIYKAKSYSKEELSFSDPLIDGKIPYITRTESNNSVEGFVVNSEYEGLEDGNALIIGDTTATVSYQKEPFIAGDHIVVIRAKWLNKYTGIFITTLLNKEKFRYCYGRAFIKELIENTKVCLPVNEIGAPDYDYMEYFIKQLNYKVITTKNKTNNNKLNINNWKVFKFIDIFNIKKGFYNKKPEHNIEGDIPFLGATENNNGVTEYYSIQDIKEASKTGDKNNAPITEKIFPAKALCVTNNGSVGFAFYQDKEFTCSHDVNPLYRKDGVEFNRYTALFIATVIMQDRYRWTYGRKWRPERMIKSTIKLPVDKQGNPDWNFMENYIKSLPYGDRI